MIQNQKILYLLKYDISKTLHENKESFINEQISDTKFGLERFGYKPNKPETLDVAVKKQREFNKTIGGGLKDIDPHDALMWASFAANFFGPFGFAASIALDFGNAYLYHKEGKDFEAGLQVAFSAIPGGELAAKIPVVKKYGKEFFEKLLQKSVKGGIITKSEREAYENLMRGAKWIKKSAQEKIFRLALKQIFKGFRLPDIVKFLWLLQKRNPNWFFLSRMGIEIGGIYYTYSKLAQIFGWEDKKEINPKLQKKLQVDYDKNIEKNNEKVLDDLSNDFYSVPENTRDSVFTNSIKELF